MKSTFPYVARTLASIALFLVASQPFAVAASEKPKPPKVVSVRLFMGYTDEQEIEILASVSVGKADIGPGIELTGDHYWTRRLADGSSKSRLDLWVSAPGGFDERTELLIFCRSVDPGVILNPDLDLPLELTDTSKPSLARVAAMQTQVTGDEFHVTVTEPLIPGIHRVYAVDGRTGMWSMRTFQVSLGR